MSSRSSGPNAKLNGPNAKSYSVRGKYRIYKAADRIDRIDRKNKISITMYDMCDYSMCDSLIRVELKLFGLFGLFGPDPVTVWVCGGPNARVPKTYSVYSVRSLNQHEPSAPAGGRTNAGAPRPAQRSRGIRAV